jgi:hypothetical protein
MHSYQPQQLAARVAAFAVVLSSGLSAQVPERRSELPVLIQAPPPAEFEFSDPVLIHAGGQPIDMGPQIGYAGPTLHDANGDGLLDLYVGSFQGKILLSMNVGKPNSPAFRSPKWLQAEGQEIQISNW